MLYKLHPNVEFLVYRQTVDNLVARLQSGVPFTMTKINHNYWESLNGQPRAAKKLDTLLGPKMLEEVKADLVSLPVDENFLFGASQCGPPGIAYSPDQQSVIAKIKESLPENFRPYEGTFWKEAYLSGEIRKFIVELQHHRVVIVGLEHLRSVGQEMGLNAEFFRLPIDTAARRYEFVDKLRAYHSGPTVYLIQAGGVLTTWLLLRLRDLPGATWIDMGRVLDQWSLNRSWSAEDLAIQPKLNALFPDLKNQHWEKMIVQKP